MKHQIKNEKWEKLKKPDEMKNILNTTWHFYKQNK